MVLLLRDTVVASWPVDGVADVRLVDDLARLQLAARRLGYSVQLRRAGPHLMELLELTGLAAVLPAEVQRCGSAVQMSGQPEGGEQVGVEEIVMTDDPVT